MVKKVKTIVKIQVTGGQLEPSKIGQALGPQGINLQQFMQQVNEATKSQPGEVIPVEITIYEDRTFEFKLKTPPAAYLLRVAARPLGEARPEGAAGIEKGSGTPNKIKVGSVTKDQVRKIAEKKMGDLNANDIDAAMRIVEGTARSMGIEVK